MFTRSAYRMLRALSAWLRRSTGWAEGLADRLEDRQPAAHPQVRPSGELEGKLGPGQPPADWLARVQSQPPAHWLERIRRVPVKQRVEIHARAQPEPRLAAPGQPAGGQAVPWPASAPPAAILPIPSGMARPVLRLTGASIPRAPGAIPGTARHPAGDPTAGAAIPLAAARPKAPVIAGLQPASFSPPRHAPGLLEPPALPGIPGDAVLTAPAKVFPVRPGSNAPPAPQQLSVKPESRPGDSPQPLASPWWPDLPPFRAQFGSLVRRAVETAPPGPAAAQDAFPGLRMPPVPGQEALVLDSQRPLPSSHWPELPLSWIEDSEWEKTVPETRQQLERRQRLDQEQRGSPWNT